MIVVSVAEITPPVLTVPVCLMVQTVKITVVPATMKLKMTVRRTVTAFGVVMLMPMIVESVIVIHPTIMLMMQAVAVLSRDLPVVIILAAQL